MDDWRAQAIERLAPLDGFDVDVGEEIVTVTCHNPESFVVRIWWDGDEFQTGFDGWHEHFDDLDDALDHFVLGLSGICRLKVITRGQTECSWTAQIRQGDGWVDVSKTGLIFIPFWRQARIDYRHNIVRRTG